MNTIAATNFGSAGPGEPPRTYFDRLFAVMNAAQVQEVADLAFAQLVLESLPEGDTRRSALSPKPEGAAPAGVLRIALSCARSVGIVPDSAQAAREKAGRLLSEGHYILWPPR